MGIIQDPTRQERAIIAKKAAMEEGIPVDNLVEASLASPQAEKRGKDAAARTEQDQPSSK